MREMTESARGASAFTRAGHQAPTQTSTQTSNGWGVLVDELLRIRMFEDDWDGEGSPAPDRALVDGAITLAHSLASEGIGPPSRVHASVNGTVYFEWHNPMYSEIEVLSPLHAEGRWINAGSDVEVFTINRWA